MVFVFVYCIFFFIFVYLCECVNVSISVFAFFTDFPFISQLNIPGDFPFFLNIFFRRVCVICPSKNQSMGKRAKNYHNKQNFCGKFIAIGYLFVCISMFETFAKNVSLSISIVLIGFSFFYQKKL